MLLWECFHLGLKVSSGSSTWLTWGGGQDGPGQVISGAGAGAAALLWVGLGEESVWGSEEARAEIPPGGQEGWAKVRDGETGASLRWEFTQELATNTVPRIHSCLYVFYFVPGTRETADILMGMMNNEQDK